MDNNKDNLIKIIDFWAKTAKSKRLFSRSSESQIDLQGEEIMAVIGPRRSGKSSLLKLTINKLPKDTWLYINFEDPFFIENNQVTIIEELIEIYLRNFSSKLKYLFFDEIQNINNWEKVIRKFQESKKYKIFITGSSSKLLSKEFATVLTGRHKIIKVLPLDFKEFLNFKKFVIEKKADLIVKEDEIKKLFKQYLFSGGFPQVVLENKPEILKQYYFDITQKDIISRYQIRQQDKLEKLGVFLLSNIANVYSVSALAKTFELSWEYISQYIDYFQEAFLLSNLNQFSYSLKTQAKSLNKIYAVDNGLVMAVSFRFSQNFGPLLENCVYNYLANNFNEVYYYKTNNNNEVDFVLKNGEKINTLVQVCANLSIESTYIRETKALVEARNELKCDNLLIITFDYQNVKVINGQKIRFIPFYKIVLGDVSI